MSLDVKPYTPDEARLPSLRVQDRREEERAEENRPEEESSTGGQQPEAENQDAGTEAMPKTPLVPPGVARRPGKASVTDKTGGGSLTREKLQRLGGSEGEEPSEDPEDESDNEAEILKSKLAGRLQDKTREDREKVEAALKPKLPDLKQPPIPRVVEGGGKGDAAKGRPGGQKPWPPKPSKTRDKSPIVENVDAQSAPTVSDSGSSGSSGFLFVVLLAGLGLLAIYFTRRRKKPLLPVRKGD